MTRAEAQIAFKDGMAVRHILFDRYEYVILRQSDNKMINEKGEVVNKMEFWLTNGTVIYDYGWEVIL